MNNTSSPSYEVQKPPGISDELLRNEIKLLSERITDLEVDLAETEKTIQTFGARHTRELGELILHILNLKCAIAEQKKRKYPDNPALKEEYEQLQNDQKEYTGTYKEVNNAIVPEPDSDKKRQIKDKFRKIVNLTHPDKVIEEYKAKAEELFIRTKKAKDANNLTEIDEILDYVEQGKPFTLKEDNLTESSALEAEIKYLKHIINDLQEKINILKNSDVYTTIMGVSNWDDYFTETKIKLQLEIKTLQKRQP